MSSSKEWWIECGANLPGGGFVRNQMMPFYKTNEFRFKYKNIGVYQTAYWYDNQNQDEANLLGDFYLDFDYNLDTEAKEQAFDIVRKDVLAAAKYLKVIMGIEPEEITYFFSGSKGIHMVIPKEILGIKPHPRLNRHFRSLAAEINKYSVSKKTIDLKIYDNKRLFRMPNSIHQKSNLYKICLSYDEVKTMTLDKIQELASAPRPIPKLIPKISSRASLEFNKHVKIFEDNINRKRDTTDIDYKLNYTPPCVKWLLENDVKSGQRNSTVAFLASFFNQSGMAEEQAMIKLEAWNEARCYPKLSEREIATTVRSMYNGAAKMGCPTGQDLSVCTEDCKFHKKNRGSK